MKAKGLRFTFGCAPVVPSRTHLVSGAFAGISARPRSTLNWTTASGDGIVQMAAGGSPKAVHCVAQDVVGGTAAITRFLLM
jgi:hypothetical protein